jgi:hypothetical protein
MLGTSSDMRPSVMGMTDCLWAMTLVEYPSWMRGPSGRSSVYKQTEESCQYQNMTRCKDGYAHIFVHLIDKLTPVIVCTRLTDTRGSSRSARLARPRNRPVFTSFHTSVVVLVVSWPTRIEEGMVYMHIRAADTGLGS